MKKFIIFLISALCLTHVASAQIQLKKSVSSKTLVSFRMGVVSLTKTGENFYLVIRSDNQYDNPYIINLGKDKATAMQSLESLIEVANTITKEESYVFENAFETLTIMRGIMKKDIWIKGDNYAGYAITNAGELKKILDTLTFEVY